MYVKSLPEVQFWYLFNCIVMYVCVCLCVYVSWLMQHARVLESPLYDSLQTYVSFMCAYVCVYMGFGVCFRLKKLANTTCTVYMLRRASCVFICFFLCVCNRSNFGYHLAAIPAPCVHLCV